MLCIIVLTQRGWRTLRLGSYMFRLVSGHPHAVQDCVQTKGVTIQAAISALALLLYVYQYAARQHPPAVLALIAACILTEQQVSVITATCCSSVSADIFEPCATSRPDFEDCAKRNLQTAVANFSAGMSNDKCWHVGFTGDEQTFLTVRCFHRFVRRFTGDGQTFLTVTWFHRFVRRTTEQKNGHSAFKDSRINTKLQNPSSRNSSTAVRYTAIIIGHQTFPVVLSATSV